MPENIDDSAARKARAASIHEKIGRLLKQVDTSVATDAVPINPKEFLNQNAEKAKSKARARKGGNERKKKVG